MTHIVVDIELLVLDGVAGAPEQVQHLSQMLTHELQQLLERQPIPTTAGEGDGAVSMALHTSLLTDASIASAAQSLVHTVFGALSARR